jgi:hypothetical protein
MLGLESYRLPEKARVETWDLMFVRRTGRAALTVAEPIMEAILGAIMRAEAIAICVRLKTVRNTWGLKREGVWSRDILFACFEGERTKEWKE